ncbi:MULTISPECIES: hypothetical protein [unclassified Desulfovibrio]|uniref:hypothetical protein n=1 Tax=unclassified Desulfovibrio TaxID=2593640 RepID=UPI0013EB4918|nr:MULTISPECIES: hypothetical protein [unclassified Desulfovibrio]
MLLTALCSACAPAPVPSEPVAAPVIVWPARCARPAAPDLPRLSGLSLLESPQGYALLKQRDRIMRDYIAGLSDALDCYEAQLPQAGAPAQGGE